MTARRLPGMDESDRSPTRAQLLDAWLDDLQVLVGRLEQDGLPDGFPFDYSPESLSALERFVLDEGADPWFRRAATGYAGEILMDVCGGRWDVDPDSGEPVVRPDPALALEPLHVGVLIDVALAEQSGEVFAREREALADAVAALRRTDPEYRPVKERSPLDPIGPQPEDPWLTRWLDDRQSAFPAWAAETGAPGGSGAWDFGPGSLDLLDRVLRARYPTEAAFDADPDAPFRAGAVWYLGEVVRRHRDSVWLYWAVEPGAPRGSHHHPDNPWSGIPFTHQPHKRRARAVDPADVLRNALHFGPGYPLRRALDGFH